MCFFRLIVIAGDAVKYLFFLISCNFKDSYWC